MREDDALLRTLFDLEVSLSGRLISETQRAHSDILSSDFREYGQSGRVWSRAEILNNMAQESNREPAEIANFQLQNLTSDVILVTYQSIRKDVQGNEAKTNRSSIWRLDPDQQWRMVFHQGTPTQ